MHSPLPIVLTAALRCRQRAGSDRRHRRCALEMGTSCMIRHDKFDYVLPGAMRRNDIDMWIVIEGDPGWQPVIGAFVAERDPQRIAVNFARQNPLADGISHTDFTALRDALGETPACHPCAR